MADKTPKKPTKDASPVPPAKQPTVDVKLDDLPTGTRRSLPPA